MGLVEGCRTLIRDEGVTALFRGLGSRCLWAASIIGGQFLLYDISRTFFNISPADLSQIYTVTLSDMN
jgi:Mitochondrial carrier protein